MGKRTLTTIFGESAVSPTPTFEMSVRVLLSEKVAPILSKATLA
jgi:hypothetical protein